MWVLTFEYFVHVWTVDIGDSGSNSVCVEITASKASDRVGIWAVMTQNLPG